MFPLVRYLSFNSAHVVAVVLKVNVVESTHLPCLSSKAFMGFCFLHSVLNQRYFGCLSGVRQSSNFLPFKLESHLS